MRAEKDFESRDIEQIFEEESKAPVPMVETDFALRYLSLNLILSRRKGTTGVDNAPKETFL